MPRTETILRVFVASPDDLAEERKTLESVIQELNITWSKNSGIRFELVGWETHTYPSVGLDAQAVINEQIGDDYDIFVGIIWTRFGTPTGRASSGTVEEFYRAYKRYQENPNQVRIMFYFKDAPVSPSDLDPEQLSLIKKFQLELGEKGTYYWSFSNRDEFVQFARMHLSRQVQEWGKSWGLEIEPKSDIKLQLESSSQSFVTENETGCEEIIEDEEEGFLDLLEDGEESFEFMNEIMTRMSNTVNNLTNKVNSGTNELLNQAKFLGGNIDIKQAKKITNRIAEALNDFADLMEVDVPMFANSYSKGMDAYSRAITLSANFSPQNKEDLKNVKVIIRQLKSTTSETKSNMLAFRNAMANTPRATTMYNRARKRALFIVDKLDEEFATALNIASEVEKSISQLIAE